jgi:ribosome-binding protein aMBF1 (putative translation factor)
MGRSIDEMKEEWARSPKFRAAYQARAAEFELASELIAARTRAGLSQAELARRMKTTQSAIARIESGRHWPSRRTLERYAKATRTRPIIRLVAAE